MRSIIPPAYKNKYHKTNSRSWNPSRCHCRCSPPPSQSAAAIVTVCCHHHSCQDPTAHEASGGGSAPPGARATGSIAERLATVVVIVEFAREADGGGLSLLSLPILDPLGRRLLPLLMLAVCHHRCAPPPPASSRAAGPTVYARLLCWPPHVPLDLPSLSPKSTGRRVRVREREDEERRRG